MRMLADDEEALPTTAVKSQTSQQPAWMRTLLERCMEWLNQLPPVRVVDLCPLSNSQEVCRYSIHWPSELAMLTPCIACLPAKERLVVDSSIKCGKI